MAKFSCWVWTNLCKVENYLNTRNTQASLLQVKVTYYRAFQTPQKLKLWELWLGYVKVKFYYLDRNCTSMKYKVWNRDYQNIRHFSSVKYFVTKGLLNEKCFFVDWMPQQIMTKMSRLGGGVMISWGKFVMISWGKAHCY